MSRKDKETQNLHSVGTAVVSAVSGVIAEHEGLSESAINTLVDHLTTQTESVLNSMINDGITVTDEIAEEVVRALHAQIDEKATVMAEDALLEMAEKARYEEQTFTPEMLANIADGASDKNAEEFERIMGLRVEDALQDAKDAIAKFVLRAPMTEAELVAEDAALATAVILDALAEAEIDFDSDEVGEFLFEEVSARSKDTKRKSSTKHEFEAQDAEHKGDWAGASKSWRKASLAAIHGRAPHTRKSLADRARITSHKAKKVAAFSNVTEMRDFFVSSLGLDKVLSEDALNELSRNTYGNYLNEVSKKTLGSYIKNAVNSKSDADFSLGMNSDKQNLNKPYLAVHDKGSYMASVNQLLRKSQKRNKGIQTATDKLYKGK